ncbi:hypothetical protein NPIL_434861 [Nephila pilipes]|uniref:Uncharacterized protein n=1 Tax=Nephila pilipes TaxID=299642 RepID=A0A8X6UM22_NEPPI|nr:hypothetical protein NPIL_434861 [Nephila pilipes]
MTIFLSPETSDMPMPIDESYNGFTVQPQARSSQQQNENLTTKSSPQVQQSSFREPRHQERQSQNIYIREKYKIITEFKDGQHSRSTTAPHKAGTQHGFSEARAKFQNMKPCVRKVQQ